MKRRYWLLLTILLATIGCAQKSTGVSGLVVDANEVSASDEEADPLLDDPAGDLDEDFMADFEDEDFAEFEDEFQATETDAYDPLETWNRGVYRFNDRAYAWVLRPITHAYRFVTPEPVRLGTRNFFHNLAMPVRAVNCLLQGKFHSAGLEVARFGVNSVVGVFGCADAAADLLDWEPQNEDLGQTLGAWGMAEGPYLFWPLMGPSTLRDSLGRGGDYFLKPLSYADAWEVELALKGIEYGNLASSSIEQYEIIQQEALEPYIALREGYLQYRRKVIQE